MKVKVKANELDTIMSGYEVEFDLPLTEQDIKKLDAIYWQEGYDIGKNTGDCREALLVEFCEKYNKDWNKYLNALASDKYEFYFIKDEDRELFTEEEFNILKYWRNEEI